jgi:hypothetical protein
LALAIGQPMSAQPSVKSWPSYSLIFVCGLVFAYGIAAAVGSLFGDAEPMLRTAGGILEIAGLFTIALGMSQLRRDCGLANTVAEMLSEWGDWLQSLWHRLRGRRDVSVAVGGAAMTGGAGTMRGHGTVGDSPVATLEEQVKILEKQVNNLSKALFDLEGKVQHESARQKAALEAEQQTRRSAIEKVEDRVKQLAVGGIRLETVGLGWLLAGVILTTWSQEITLLLAEPLPALAV